MPSSVSSVCVSLASDAPSAHTGASSAPAELPSRSCEAKRVCYLATMLALFAAIAYQAGWAIIAAHSWGQALGLVVLMITSAAAAVCSGHLAHSAFMVRMSAQEEADWTLLSLACMTPGLLLLARFFPLPTSDDTKANCLVTFAFLLRLGALMDLPPVHVMVQCLLSFPILTFLDYHRRCHQPAHYPSTCAFHPAFLALQQQHEEQQQQHEEQQQQQQQQHSFDGGGMGGAGGGGCSHCCSVPSLLHHLGTRGIFMLAVGAVWVSVPVIMNIRKSLGYSGEPAPAATPAPAPAPPPAPPPAAQSLGLERSSAGSARGSPTASTAAGRGSSGGGSRGAPHAASLLGHHGRPTPSSAPDPAALECVLSDVPLESLGCFWVARSGALPSLRWVETRMTDAARAVDESLLVCLVCIPIGLYYFGHSLLSRIMPRSYSTDAITSDEWLLAMSVFFVLGRESCMLDMLPHFKHLNSKLRVSQEILKDMLPDHVVSLLVNRAEDTSASGASALAAAAADDDDALASPSQLASAASEALPDIGAGGSAAGPPAADPAARAARISAEAEHTPSGRAIQDSDELRSTSSEADVFPSVFAPLAVYRRSEQFPASSAARPGAGGALRAPQRSIGAASSSAASSSGAATSSTRTRSGPLAAAVAAVRPLRVAENHDNITVFLSDICGFSSFAHKLPPAEVMSTLNDLYSRLDDVLVNEFPSLYKVETIGDAYVVAGNLVSHDLGHAATVLRFAIRAQQEATRVPRPDCDDGSPVQLRIGLNSGPAVSGIVGKLRRRFCIFGATVDLAMRTESTCPNGCIQLTAATHKLVAGPMASEIYFQDRGRVAMPGYAQPVQAYLAVPRDVLIRTKMLAAAGVEI